MRCPTCKKPVPSKPAEPGGRTWSPFCSERCKLVDLGKWLDGKYQIPVEADLQDEGEHAPPAAGDEEQA